ncbi:hypothetical protein C1646_692269 [Rhizophagus diaphanus]|nr:hypothetical protein C1646_692269 [Rhizophagus diaphanus] [Rhizophagus sp. MUCL 43196]
MIWDNLIRWSFAQHPFIKEDIKQWNTEEIAIMESTLHRFLPLIRFYHISSIDFHSKVYPFKVILPKDLINEMLVFYLVPSKKLNVDIQLPRYPKYDTDLIKFKHFAIFSSWIEKESDSYYYKKNIPYQFNLIYRASKDGKTAKAFHKKCDNRGPTIVIIKIKGTEQIIGGYNPFSWDSSKSYKYTTDSFMFSFTDRKNTKTAEVSFSNGTYSIGCYPTHGPIFGGDFSCKDCATNWKFNNYFHSYPDINIPTGSIQVDDYEVFQVKKLKSNLNDKLKLFKKKSFLKSLFKK